MKLFITKLCAYSLLCLLAIGIILYALSPHYYDSRVPAIKRNCLVTAAKDGDSINLVLGSSHAFFGIDSKQIEGKWFNLGSISQGLMEDFAIVQFCKQNKIHIKQVVLPISYFSNGYYLYKTAVGGEQIRMFDYEHVYNIDYPKSISIEGRFTLFSEIAKSVFSTSEAAKIDAKGNLIEDCNGQPGNLSNAKETFDRHNIDCDFSITNPYLDSITRFCLENNVRLYFVIMPFSKEYRDLISTKQFEEFVQKIKLKHTSSNCFLFDNRELFSVAEESRMFRDVDHLSACGKKIYSSLLNKQINNSSSSPEHNPAGSY